MLFFSELSGQERILSRLLGKGHFPREERAHAASPWHASEGEEGQYVTALVLSRERHHRGGRGDLVGGPLRGD